MKYLIAGCQLLASGILCAQVSGEVRGDLGNQSSEVLPGATLVWAGTQHGTIADASGRYALALVDGSDLLVVSYVGYQTDTVQWTGQQELNILLLPMTGPAVEVKDHLNASTINTKDPLRFQTITEKELCKAACCNLSESFETNASIDAAFTDAITGTRQIRMLGLDGKYTQIMFDNIPAVRGLASTYGLTYVPGPWIKSIVIAKGVGSVLNGFESITGQINVAHKNADNSEKFHLNGYAGSGGRMELNLVWNPFYEKVHGSSDGKIHLYPTLLAHGAMSNTRTDMNGDGFMDNPLFTNVILRNEWVLESDGGLGGHYAVTLLHLENTSGKLEYSPGDEIRQALWGAHLTTNRAEVSAKTGYAFEQKDWKSFGTQFSWSGHEQLGNYGYRTYAGKQQSLRANLMYASRFSALHTFTIAFSYQYDDYREYVIPGNDTTLRFTPHYFNRLEKVPGSAMEYMWKESDWLVVVAGLRADYHNRYGMLITPRLHARFSISPSVNVKVVGGKGYRTPQVLMDNVGMLASNRDIEIESGTTSFPFGLDMEESWNTGLLLSYKTEIGYREAIFSLDAYHTSFVRQLIMDMETPKLVRFYNLEGTSYSHSVQFESQWSPFRRFDLRIAYRWLDVRSTYASELLEKPLINRHRAFMNIAYETKARDNGAQWKWDLTAQWISSKRIPIAEGHEGHSLPNRSVGFVLVNAQITRVIRDNFEIYLGGENLTNFMQHQAIISSEDPSSESFDASLIWGPVFGRMGYVGFRWKL
ncbi:MAG: TonB-dependent receptor [Flavobacteriales bacterium]|nr:TonB-dependent receptor [Flavobacteriales bacterium]